MMMMMVLVMVMMVMVVVVVMMMMMMMMMMMLTVANVHKVPVLMRQQPDANRVARLFQITESQHPTCVFVAVEVV